MTARIAICAMKHYRFNPHDPIFKKCEAKIAF